MQNTQFARFPLCKNTKGHSNTRPSTCEQVESRQQNRATPAIKSIQILVRSTAQAEKTRPRWGLHAELH
ncbi:hypothetical protein VFPPC_16688 [Pochonia chlamydosporia 170]|uniref:Uncharacterized protein n=1 Tax=Pochonia chlamydosporia 170 TaxID=1380566 RepID=A0A179F6L8_METCM|nr:hypothetical protein VFPPC_16688 [Pochonia chlamydosporia 170]OAQ60981.1 hypothetical protein VFPPC_16688 [Pochonia chlamydosporia 170]